MNTLGAMLSGRTPPPDAATARGPDPEAAGADIFGAVLGALKGAMGAEASRTDDPDRPASRHADATPEAAAPATPSEIVNPLFLLAAMVPARSDASPSPPRESLEALVARTLPAGIPAMDAGVALSADPATPAGLPTPDARTRVTVLSRETHFAPVLPQILAAPAPSPATPIPAGVRDGLIRAPAPAVALIPSASPGSTPSGFDTLDLAHAGTGNDPLEAQPGPAAPVPRMPVETRLSPAFAEARAIPAADAPVVQAVPGPEPAPQRQVEAPAPTRVDPTAPTIPVESRAVAVPEPSTPSVAAASPQPDARVSAMPRADTEDRPQAPLPASAGPGEARPPGGKPRATEAVSATGMPVQGETAPERPIPGAGAAHTRSTAPRPAQPPETVADPAIHVRASASTPGPAARDEAPAAGSDRHRTEAAPARPPDRASIAVTAPVPPTRDSNLGAFRAGEAGSTKPAETAAAESGGATTPTTATATEPAPLGLGPAGALPPAAPPAPAQQVAAAILGAVPRGATVATQGAAGLDGPLRILTLQLHPADLGTVLVRMRLRDGQLEMSLQASREETATLLAEGGDALADLLRQGGYQPERVTIVGGPPPPAPTEAQAFQTRADAGPDQPPPDQSGRRQPEGRATPSAETQPDSHERTHASVTSSSERGGVYL